jgi:hypothetical protein
MIRSPMMGSPWGRILVTMKCFTVKSSYALPNRDQKNAPLARQSR